MKHAFISHASKDHEIALQIRRLLESRGITCWIAPDDIVPGRDYGEEIIRGLEQTVTTVLLLSENSNASPFVKREIERAVSKGKPVLPIRIQNVLPSPGLELFISSSHWIDAWQNSVDSKIDELAAAIRGRLDALDPASAAVAETQAKAAPPPPPPRPRSRPLWQYATGIAASAAALIAAALFFTMGTPPDKKMPAPEAASQPARVNETPAPAPPATVSPSTSPLQPPATVTAGDAIVPATPAARVLAPSAKQANTVEKAKPVRARSSARDTGETARAPHVTNTAATGSCTSALQRASLGEPLSNEEKTLLRTKC